MVLSEIDEEFRRGSHLKLARRHRKIISGELKGEKIWQPTVASPGVTGPVSVRFVNSNPLPQESTIVFELPDHGWVISHKPNSTIKLPSNHPKVSLKAKWNKTNRKLIITTLDNDINPNTSIEIIIPGVKTPECATGAAQIVVTTIEKKIILKTVPESIRGGCIIDGPSNFSIPKILPGVITGKKTWKANNSLPGKINDVNLSFQTAGAIPLEGKVLVELPDDGWGIPECPSVKVMSSINSKTQSIQCESKWDSSQKFLEIVLTDSDFEIGMGTVVFITIYNVKNPDVEIPGKNLARLTTLVSNGGVIDGPCKITTSRISVLKESEIKLASEMYEKNLDGDNKYLKKKNVPKLLKSMSMNLSPSSYSNLVEENMKFCEIDEVDVVKMEDFLDWFTKNYASTSRFGQHLRLAAGRGDVATVVDLIERGVNPNGVDGAGCTALHYCAEYGHVSIIDAIISTFEDNVDIDAEDNSKWTPLLSAASNGHVDVVEKLIKMKANKSATSKEGRTALHWACIRGNDTVLSSLLLHGLNVNSIDRSLWTPIHFAAMHGNVSCIKALIEKGANYALEDAFGYKMTKYCDPTVLSVVLPYIEKQESSAKK